MRTRWVLIKVWWRYRHDKLARKFAWQAIFHWDRKMITSLIENCRKVGLLLKKDDR